MPAKKQTKTYKQKRFLIVSPQLIWLLWLTQYIEIIRLSLFYFFLFFLFFSFCFWFEDQAQSLNALSHREPKRTLPQSCPPTHPTLQVSIRFILQVNIFKSINELLCVFEEGGKETRQPTWATMWVMIRAKSARRKRKHYTRMWKTWRKPLSLLPSHCKQASSHNSNKYHMFGFCEVKQQNLIR